MSIPAFGARATAVSCCLHVSVAAAQVLVRLPLGRKRPATISDLEWHTDAASATSTHHALPTTASVDVAGDSKHIVDPMASRPDQTAGPQAARFDGSASAAGVLPLPLPTTGACCSSAPGKSAAQWGRDPHIVLRQIRVYGECSQPFRRDGPKCYSSYACRHETASRAQRPRQLILCCSAKADTCGAAAAAAKWTACQAEPQAKHGLAGAQVAKLGRCKLQRRRSRFQRPEWCNSRRRSSQLHRFCDRVAVAQGAS